MESITGALRDVLAGIVLLLIAILVATLRLGDVWTAFAVVVGSVGAGLALYGLGGRWSWEPSLPRSGGQTDDR